MKLPEIHDKNLFITVCSLITGLTVFAGMSYGTARARVYHPAPREIKRATVVTRKIAGPPTAINIPKIHKNLQVKPAQVSGNTWGMYDDAVAWLATSATPGHGNVILYAHDRVNLWADLSLLKTGDLVQIQEDSVWRNYVVTASQAIDPHDVQAVLVDKNQLTMYTCEGSFDQKRRVVYAKPVN